MIHSCLVCVCVFECVCVRRRRTGEEEEKEKEEADTELTTKTPHVNVGNNLFFTYMVFTWLCVSHIFLL